MAKLQFGASASLAATILLFLLLPACGGKKSGPPVSAIPARISVVPNPSYSIQAGTTLQLFATAQNAANANVNAAFTYNSSNTSILDISPTGNVCAGIWNAPAYSICTAGTEGVAQVTASALGVTSPPTFFFVHPPIASIQISVVPPVNSPPPACPNQTELPPACIIPFNPTQQCLSQNQLVTLQATALDPNGNDMTPQVGPFTWTEGSTTVVKVTPIVTINTYNVPTNQATVTETTPGQTQIVASAAGAFSQPYNIESCPVQCIDVQLGVTGQQQSNLTNFVVNKGTSETITATAVDVQGCIVPKPQLTWVSSNQAAISVASGCANSTTCTVSTPLAGAASITANCTPPSCNTGFPLNPAGFPTGSIYIPQPVFPVTPISGIATGAAATATVLATTQDCYSIQLCTVGAYSVSSTTNLSGGAIGLPAPPNSLMFDPAGDKAYAGSEFGSYTINPADFGTSSNPFSALAAPGTPLGLVTGKVLAVSQNGSSAIFSDTVSTPNQVYGVNTSPASTVAFDINGATAAAFSPDGLRAYILANGGTSLYSYSALEYLQEVVPTLPSPATSIVFNSNGLFALLAGGGAASNLAVYRTIDNSSLTISAGTMPGPPLFLTMVPGGNVPLGGVFGNTVIPPLETTGLDFFFGLDNTGIDIIATNSEGSLPPPCTQTQQVVNAYIASTAPTNPCMPFDPVYINLGQGTFHPINFFVAPSATQAYIVASDRGVLIYNFNTGSVSKIPLVNNATPIAASLSADGALIYVSGSDGLLHQLNPSLLSDEFQTSFTPLPNSPNSFCYIGNNNCTLDLLAVRP
jgi:hypothetical protein